MHQKDTGPEAVQGETKILQSSNTAQLTRQYSKAIACVAMASQSSSNNICFAGPCAIRKLLLRLGQSSSL